MMKWIGLVVKKDNEKRSAEKPKREPAAKKTELKKEN